MCDFSVLLPIYNRVELKTTFPKCLDAISKLSVLPSEVLIVCDGPIGWDIDQQVQNYLPELNIKVFRLQQNLGLSKALNIGLQECKYDIIARVDADDYCSQDRFAKQLKLIGLGFNLIGSNIQEIDEVGLLQNIREVPRCEIEIKKFALRRNPFNHMSIMYHRELLFAVGGYPNFHLKEDYALWVLLLSKKMVKPINIQENLMMVTAGRNLYSRRSSIRILGQELRMQFFLRKHLKKPFQLMILDFLLRFLFYFLPIQIKEFLYKKMLRK